MVATSGFLTALECTEFVFGRGSTPDPTGGGYSAPLDPLAGLRSLHLSGGKGRRRGKREKKVRGRGREGPAPLTQIHGSAPGELREAAEFSPSLAFVFSASGVAQWYWLGCRSLACRLSLTCA